MDVGIDINTHTNVGLHTVHRYRHIYINNYTHISRSRRDSTHIGRDANMQI